MDNGPDGNRWVEDVFVAAADGTGAVNLTGNPFPERAPMWSPNGSQIAYLHYHASFRINADGTGRNLITVGGAPAWSLDGTKVAVSRDNHQYWPYNMDIYTANVDGSELTNLIGDPRTGPWDAEPEWSPDGSVIAFVSDRANEGRGDHHIWTVRPDGTGLRRVTRDRAGAPTWSPDGNWILFTRRLPFWGEDTELWLIRPDGTGERQLTDNGFSEFAPAWSPDGTKILFNRSAGQTADIWVMDADGTGERRLIENGWEPDWQPIVNRPPQCETAVAGPSLLTKVNRLPVPVRIENVIDPDGDPVSLRVEAVSQDEPVTAPGDDTFPDAARTPEPDVVELRAERNPRGDGRAYRISFTASDPQGSSCRGVAAVMVPRHKDEPAIDSAPPAYDSLAP